MRDLHPDRACSCAFTCPNDRNSPNNEGNRMAAQRQIAFYGKAEALSIRWSSTEWDSSTSARRPRSRSS
ncbi:hypothetical protein CN198_29855 [Sinorhizobium meliloti]|nr:hypothetical protein CN198_29855 [Sinorhizobium meliloti]RVK62910.1 hypothetical protein CN159_29855 [Sinorhizobium meliloti]